MVQTILVPLDGSLLAERALPYAIDLGRALHARVLLLRVVQAPALSDRPEAENDARAYLKVTADLLRAERVEVETRVAYRYLEDVGQAIANVVGEWHPDLVLMSTHGRGGLDRLLFGSVADGVIRRVNRPVLLIGAACQTPWPTQRPPRALVPLDGSDFALEALGPAGELLDATGGELVLAQVVELPNYVYGADGFAYTVLDTEELQARAAAYLEETAAGLRARGRQVQTVTAVGYAPATIARLAREQRADLIAMATHGRGGLARMVLGSVAMGTLQQAHVPLLLIRPAGVAAEAKSTAPETSGPPA